MAREGKLADATQRESRRNGRRRAGRPPVCRPAAVARCGEAVQCRHPPHTVERGKAMRIGAHTYLFTQYGFDQAERLEEIFQTVADHSDFRFGILDLRLGGGRAAI
jgi:hypothetical protein